MLKHLQGIIESQWTDTNLRLDSDIGHHANDLIGQLLTIKLF